MKLIDNWKAALGHYSTKALAMAAGLQGVWAGLPDWVHAELPHSVGHTVAWVTFSVAVLGLGGKFVDQSPKDQP
jgi:hypothetical protein